MNVVLTLIAAAIFLGILFFVLLLIGIIQKKKELIYVSIFSFILGGACGIWAVYEAVTRTVDTLEEAFKPTTAEELFSSTYGAQDSCTTVMHFKIAQIPRIDNFNLMQGSTCPDQIKMMLQNKSFEESQERLSSSEVSKMYSITENWMNAQLLGDSINIWLHHNYETQYTLTLITNLDSTAFLSIESFDH